MDFDVDFVAPNCVGPWSYSRSFYLQIILPILFNLGAVAFSLITSPFRHKKWQNGIVAHSLASGFKHQAVVTLIVYHTQVLTSTAPFGDCDPPLSEPEPCFWTLASRWVGAMTLRSLGEDGR